MNTPSDLSRTSTAQMPVRRIRTFAFHISVWKQKVFCLYFPDRDFVFPRMYMGADEFASQWAARIIAERDAEVFVWSKRAPPGLVDLARKHRIPLYFIEDGFIRSVKANASRTPPLSLTLDQGTAYFDSNAPSDLENLLKTHDFDGDPALMERARAGIRFMLERGVSKYNSDVKSDMNALYGRKMRKRVLVIGQVEDDASIQYGCARPVTNNDLVVLAATENPGADILYKPHPDILNRVRLAQSDPQDVRHLCGILSAPLSMAQAFETIDHVYTITSLAGFEALMRGIKVTAFGCPFYAGWGLTDDRQPNPRRGRTLSIEELFAGTFLLYPHYFDPDTGSAATFETTVQSISNHFARSATNEDDDIQKRDGLRAGPLWRAYGPYGLLGWRHLLTPLISGIIGKVSGQYDVQIYREDPITFFREVPDAKLRLLGRILYPFSG
ncbi:cell surface protein [Pararhizobium antarcticum]|uniref:Cell surface protein n=2 Tax=Pararhizobium antarcticum TaxID=1798805 RepID=A0A657M2A0_9HYPH|nr:cell surface protein [Rhizobium sp. 58]OJG01002.1 cell surface protein [Pararhizobium antarcticum]